MFVETNLTLANCKQKIVLFHISFRYYHLSRTCQWKKNSLVLLFIHTFFFILKMHWNGQALIIAGQVL